VLGEIGKIDQGELAEYGGGWRGEIGTALVDAVFSIRARYQTKDPAKGVHGRVQNFRDLHPGATDDLRALTALGPTVIADVMGATKTGRRAKGECVLEAAQRLLALDPSVATAQELERADQAAIKAAYTGVPGLGWVTYEYFLMLLGVPGVKADTMIVRFVNHALEASGLDAVDAHEARELVIAAHASEPRGVSLTAYDHAIWRAKGELVIESDSDA
jgi:hypothetical protein